MKLTKFFRNSSSQPKIETIVSLPSTFPNTSSMAEPIEFDAQESSMVWGLQSILSNNSSTRFAKIFNPTSKACFWI